MTGDDIPALIEKVAKVEDRLKDNERALFDDIRHRLSGNGGEPRFEDKTCLEVMLRNVTIRGRGA